MGDDRQGVATGLTRGEAAKVLGVHVSSVRRYEERGWLRPKGGAGEERRFDEAEVRAFAKTIRRDAVELRPTGTEDAAAFRLFRRGASHEEVVIALELQASRVRELFAQWRAGYHASATKTPEPKEQDYLDIDRTFREWEQAMAAAHSLEEAPIISAVQAARAPTLPTEGGRRRRRPWPRAR